MKKLLPFVLLVSLVMGLPFAVAASREKGAKPQRVAFGQSVELADFAVPGKTTIFDFTSRFCGPCQRLAPHLDALHEKRDDLAVVAVDINRPDVQGIDWESPVARKYDIRSIPQFKVFGPDGKLQAEGDEAEKLVMHWLGE